LKNLIDISKNISEIEAWDVNEVVGLHFELTDYMAYDTINELSEMKISDWVSSAKTDIMNSRLRMSIGVPQGLSLNLLSELFNTFDMVFVRDSGSPNLNRVNSSFTAEMNLNKDKFVLSFEGSEFADRIHLENYLASLYENIGLHNFSFSSFSALIDVDYKTFEREMNHIPASLMASVQDQIYTTEEGEAKQYSSASGSYLNKGSKKEKNVGVIPQASGDIYRIQVAASKKKLSAESLKVYGDEDIREVKIGVYYKYTIRKYSNKDAAKGGLDTYRSKSGNTNAFLVTY